MSIYLSRLIQKNTGSNLRNVTTKYLSWGHAIASQLGWGQDSDWVTPEGIFSSVEAILCFGSLSCCITQLLLSFKLSDRQPVLLKNVLINLGIIFSVDYSKLSGPWGTKAAPNMMLPSTYFTVRLRFWCWCAVSFFLHTYELCVPSQQLNFSLIGPQNILPVVLWNIQILFCKLQMCSNVLLDSSGFFRGVLP
jgi:hypothetical protein